MEELKGNLREPLMGDGIIVDEAQREPKGKCKWIWEISKGNDGLIYILWIVTVPLISLVAVLYFLSPTIEYCWLAVWRFVAVSLLIELATICFNMCSVCLLANWASIMKWAYANLVISTLWLLWYLVVIMAFFSENNDCGKTTPTIFYAHFLLTMYGFVVLFGWGVEVTTITCATFCDRCLPKEL